MPKEPLPSGPAAALAPESGRDVTAEFAPAAQPWTVTALVARIREALLDGLPGRLCVVGEISNFKRHASGHLYFSLKDQTSCIDAVMFRPEAATVRFDPSDGLEVLAEGHVDVYDKQGRLQLYVQRLSPRGTGALELAFRQLKQRLQREGLFDPAHKVAPPRFPRGIGVITSPTGAAVRDIATTLARRWPAAGVYLLPVRVQGEAAAEEIARAVALLDRQAGRLGIDTLILARGGGSLEDLWAFNEETVARAIFAARRPVITGIGHETDFTIADFVADVRAATPTAAAELAVPDRAALARTCSLLAGRMSRQARGQVAHARAVLDGLVRSAVFRDPSWRVRSARQTVDELAGRLEQGLSDAARSARDRIQRAWQVLREHHPLRQAERAGAALAQAANDLRWALGSRAKQVSDRLLDVQADLRAAHPRHRLRLASARLQGLGRQLEALSYRAALRRGYSVTRRADGRLLRSTGETAPGDWLDTELADGRVRSQVGGLDPASPPRRRRRTDAPDGPSLFAASEQ